MVYTAAASVYDQPDAAAVEAQFDRLLDYARTILPDAADHLDAARADLLAFTAFPIEVYGDRSGPTTVRSASTRRSAAAPTQ